MLLFGQTEITVTRNRVGQIARCSLGFYVFSLQLFFFYTCWGESSFCLHTTDKRPQFEYFALSNSLNTSCEDQFYFEPVTHNAVEKVVMSVPLNKAPGFDEVPVKVYSDCVSHVLGTITDLIHLSFECSTFPRVWKKAEIVPLVKSGDHDVPSNNRPISFTSCSFQGRRTYCAESVYGLSY